ncbi:MAG: hypothetical protein R2838_11155 [Caldilineaceae bacterium]
MGNDAFVRTLLARNGGLLVVTAPLFLLHWGYIQRNLVDDDERRARHAQVLPLHRPPADHPRWSTCTFDPPRWRRSSPRCRRPRRRCCGCNRSACWRPVSDCWAITTTCCKLTATTATRSGSASVLASALSGLGGTGRRGHVDAGNGGRGVLLDFGLERFARPRAWALPGRSRWRGLATLLTGALLTHWAGRQWQTVIALNPDGATSAWRRLYLYGAVVIGAVATLTPAAPILEGSSCSSARGRQPVALLLDKLISPLAYVPGGVGLVGLPADPGPGAGALRRQRCEHHRRPIYNYVVAATALISAVDREHRNLAGAHRHRVQPRVVGARPVWVQPLATGPESAGRGSAGVDLPLACGPNRRAGMTSRKRTKAHLLGRRIFLFGLALVSAVLVVVFLAQVIYRVFLLLLGAPDAGLWSAEAANELARRGLRGLALHRDDHPRRRPMPPVPPAVDTPRPSRTGRPSLVWRRNWRQQEKNWLRARRGGQDSK